ncbi:MAG: hypothetical protein O2791_04850, partial [Bacteroidetes bacterium]|nr:hypothetical protein [Bacteroidota bacterium]
MTYASTTPSIPFALRALMGLGMLLFMNACLMAAPRNVGATEEAEATGAAGAAGAAGVAGDPKGDEKGAKPVATAEG